MKKYLLLIFLSGASAAEDYIFFLKSDENLKLVGDNYDVVKKELDTMLKEYKKLSKVNNFWKIENLEEVDVYEKINLDEYTILVEETILEEIISEDFVECTQIEVIMLFIVDLLFVEENIIIVDICNYLQTF